MSSLRRNLRQVSHAKHLMVERNRRHFFSDHSANLSAHIRIHLVEDQQRHAIQIREHRFQREHHTGQFTARGDLTQSQWGLADIGRKEKFARAVTHRSWFLQTNHLHLKISLFKP